MRPLRSGFVESCHGLYQIGVECSGAFLCTLFRSISCRSYTFFRLIWRRKTQIVQHNGGPIYPDNISTPRIAPSELVRQVLPNQIG